MLYVILWFLTNIGIILNKLWDETCPDLFQYLLIMSFLCIGGAVIYLYLGIVRHGSDTQWLVLSLIGFFCSILLTVFICWGGVRLIYHAGIFGVDQCFGCLYSNGTKVAGKCSDAYSCDPTSWKMIYQINECSLAESKNIDCELTNLCRYSAEETFYYSAVVTGCYLVVILFNALVIFTRMIPSLFLQSSERSRLV